MYVYIHIDCLEMGTPARAHSALDIITIISLTTTSHYLVLGADG